MTPPHGMLVWHYPCTHIRFCKQGLAEYDKAIEHALSSRPRRGDTSIFVGFPRRCPCGRHTCTILKVAIEPEPMVVQR